MMTTLKNLLCYLQPSNEEEKLSHGYIPAGITTLIETIMVLLDHDVIYYEFVDKNILDVLTLCFSQNDNIVKNSGVSLLLELVMVAKSYKK